MKSLSKTIAIEVPPNEVFAQLDNFSKTGMHMSESSMMMMGSKLSLEQVSTNAVGPGATYRWYGKMLGMTIDFKQAVTTWEPPQRKAWETEPEAKIIIMRWYRMGFELKPLDNGTEVMLFINYLPPRQWYFQVLSALFAPWYCNWCLNSMLQDTQAAMQLRSHVEQPLNADHPA
jgi:hypothetical protein